MNNSFIMIKSYLSPSSLFTLYTKAVNPPPSPPLSQMNLGDLLVLIALSWGTVLASNKQPGMTPTYVIGDVIVTVGGGWYLINFGLAGTTPGVQFLFSNSISCLLQFTDLQCPGDRFYILDNGRKLGTSGAVCPSIIGNCTNRIDDPTVAFQRPNQYSTFFTYLGSGSHNITIQVIDSPMTCGFAAIRFDANVYRNDPIFKLGQSHFGGPGDFGRGRHDGPDGPDGPPGGFGGPDGLGGPH